MFAGSQDAVAVAGIVVGIAAAAGTAAEVGIAGVVAVAVAAEGLAVAAVEGGIAQVQVQEHRCIEWKELVQVSKKTLLTDRD